MRGEGDIGDAGAIGPCEKGSNRSGGGNKEIGRQQGRGEDEDKRGQWGEDTKIKQKIIEEHEGGGVVRDGEHRPLSEGVREEENPTGTHATG